MLATSASLWRHPMAASGLAMHPALARGHTAMRYAPSLPCPYCSEVCLPALLFFIDVHPASPSFVISPYCYVECIPLP